MKVLDSELLKGYARMTMDGFNQGWHERNGGNLSYRLKPEEVELLKDDFDMDGQWQEIGWQKNDESAFRRRRFLGDKRACEPHRRQKREKRRDDYSEGGGHCRFPVFKAWDRPPLRRAVAKLAARRASP